MEQLKTLKQCFEDRMMTQDEFEIRRKQLIDKMTGTQSDVATIEKNTNTNNDENQTNGAQDKLKPLFDLLSPKKTYPSESIDIETDDNSNKMDSHIGLLTPMSKAATKLTQMRRSTSKEMIITKSSLMKTTSMEIELEPTPMVELKQATTDITENDDTEIKIPTKISKKED